MKITDVPEAAFTAKPTPIPMKSVPDCEAMLAVLIAKGFVVIEADEMRVTSIGTQEAVNVKNFNSFVRVTKHRKLLTKRVSNTRWVCVLGE